MDRKTKDYLIDIIENGKEIPRDFKYKLFPETKDEYEIVYSGKMRKEDILGNEDGTFPLPLQVDRVFNNEKFESYDDDWQNMIVLGDNLQFLKTVNADKDPVIKNKLKGKVKFIYIDPPFATQDEFRSADGIKAYNDKKQGAEFIEFIRRRLIVAKEIISPDGYIAVHLDQKMNSYIRVIMDEVFGKNNLVNEIIWRYFMGGKSTNFFSKKHDTIYIYKMSGKPKFNIPDRERVLESKPSLSSTNNTLKEYKAKELKTKEERMFYTSSVKQDDVFEISGVFNLSREYLPYPTQKPEELLKELILAITNEGDIVMDFFGGSGTTMSVAEKLNRKWVVCDLGKLSYFTMQKRLLNIGKTNSLTKKQLYNKKPKSFITCKLGVYDLGETLNMEWEKYKTFVSQIFEFNIEENRINGVLFDGKKRDFPVKIFNYELFKDTNIDGLFLNELSKSLGSSTPKRIYIVSPATRVSFIADYEEVNGTRFYFLQVPYEMIRELHKTPFVQFRQPKSKSDINSIEEMKGFQFVYKPEVSCRLQQDGDLISFIIDKFESSSLEHGVINDFSTLSSIYVNYNSDEEIFVMDDVRFWDEIESTKKTNSDTEIIYNNEKISQVVWYFNKNKLGVNPMFLISDIYGNDFLVKPEIGETK